MAIKDGSKNNTPAFSILWQCSKKMGAPLSLPLAASARNPIQLAPIPNTSAAEMAMAFRSAGVLPCDDDSISDGISVFFLNHHFVNDT